jgi:hypothetical protein
MNNKIRLIIKSIIGKLLPIGYLGRVQLGEYPDVQMPPEVQQAQQVMAGNLLAHLFKNPVA